MSAATYVGADYTTVASWRTTSVAKPLDANSDNIYGSDGYYVVASGASRVVQPPYASIALLPGIATFPGCGFCGGESGYALIDDPQVPPGVGPIPDVLTGIYYNSPGGTNPTTWFQITFTRPGIFRLGIITDSSDYRAQSPTNFRLLQNTGGTVDTGYISAAANRDRSPDFYFFDIVAKPGDVFHLSGQNDPGFIDNGIAGIFFDNLLPPATANITVNAVNDAPAFTSGANQIVMENAGAQSVASWATGIGAGPAAESEQLLTITATSSNPALIANPTVTYGSPNAAGSLSFTPAANANGTATITVTVTDDGGTAGGGIDFVARLCCQRHAGERRARLHDRREPDGHVRRWRADGCRMGEWLHARPGR